MKSQEPTDYHYGDHEFHINALQDLDPDGSYSLTVTFKPLHAFALGWVVRQMRTYIRMVCDISVKRLD